MNRKSAYNRNAGFTLIEIMVVVVILGMLATLVIQAVGDRPDQARAVKVKNDITALEGALKLYRLDNYRYPSTEEGLESLVRAPQSLKTWNGPYVERLPTDPWGRDYLYRTPSEHGRKFDLFTLGADGIKGGDAMDADIGNWNLE